MPRSIFRPSKSEIWAQIAADIGGDFIDGGFWKRAILRYEHEEWRVVLDLKHGTSVKKSTGTLQNFFFL